MTIKTELINVFFDESGKRKDKPNLMGGLSIPTELYTSSKFELLTQRLRDKDLKLHWTNYTGYEKLKKDITEAIETISLFHNMIKFFVINYDYTLILSKKGLNNRISDICN